MRRPGLAPSPRRDTPRLALVFSDGSLTVLWPGARADEAAALCDDDTVRIVRVLLEIIDDVDTPSVQFALEDGPHG